jgi:hypothetical protein
VRPDREEQFVRLLAGHWSALHRLEFVTSEEALVYRSVQDPPTYVELFTWIDGGFDLAHEHPEVLSIWERMDPCLEERDGQRKWEFPHYERIAL